MAETIDVAVVGAGPFGLSVAAHLPFRSVRTFGEPMETWRRRMPRGMLLRSAWEETSLSAPSGGTLDDWTRLAAEPRAEPIPLEMFIRYSDWFADRFVPNRDPDNVAGIEQHASGFRLVSAGGAEVDARALVLAVGVVPFAYVPPGLKTLFGDEAVGLASALADDVGQANGRRVLVVGGGQAGLETSGLMAQAGATVELVTRSQVRWFADREPHYPRGPVQRRLYRLAYPVVGYGPPPLNRLVIMPDLFAALPSSARVKLTARLLRSGGSPWLRTLVDRSVKVTEFTTVEDAAVHDSQLVVRLSNGEEREVDQVLVACGYRFDLDRLEFLSSNVRSGIATRDGWPVIDRHFRSSDRSIHFVGYAAERRFGPLSRFVLGADFTARRVHAALAG